MSEEEQKAIEIVKKIKNMKFKVTSSFYSSGTISLSIEEREAINTVLNLITKLQKENEEKDKIIYEVAKSNIKLKGYEVEEKYIDTTIRFFTKYVKNLERNPQWRNDKNE